MLFNFYTIFNVRPLTIWLLIKKNVYETDCGKCEEVYFGESKRSFKSRSDEHKKTVRNCDCDNNEIAKQFWYADHNFSLDQKNVVDSESRLIPGKIKETIILWRILISSTKISYMFPEIWFLNFVLYCIPQYNRGRSISNPSQIL